MEVQNYIVSSARFLLGLCVAVTYLILVVISIPVIIYRWILYRFIAPMWRPDLVDIVSMKSQGFATEFLPNFAKLPARCSVVTTIITEGTTEKQEWLDILNRNWIGAIYRKDGELKYPELKQYMEYWMGYMFWVKDENFDLKNHLHIHTLDKDMTPEEAKCYVDDLRETILGAPYPSRRSPWDLHVIKNYKDPELQHLTKEKFMTATLFRMHHSMADGYSIMSLLVEGLCGAPLGNCKIAKSPEAKINLKEKVLNILRFPFQIIHDLGYTIYLFLPYPTPFSMKDELKVSKMFIKKSGLIPIRKIKDIKNSLGSSFNGVVLSSMGSGIGETFKRKGYKGSLQTLPFAITMPLPGHSDKMDNHATGTIFELPITPSLDPLERLRRTEKSMVSAKKSCLPILSPISQKFAFVQPAPIARHLFYNRFLHTGSSDFPGPQGEMKMVGKKVVSCHFIVGQMIGICGISFTTLSVGENLQISMSVQPSVLSRDEVGELMSNICKEIDKLYDKSLEIRKNCKK